MPKATSNIQETIRKDLKTCEGGFVVLRRLTYGEKLFRQSMVSKFKIEAEKGSKDFAGEMQLVSEQATLFDFQNCVVDHNLFKDDEETQKLNFGNLIDVKSLDPRIGEEIDTLISELNNFEEDEEGN